MAWPLAFILLADGGWGAIKFLTGCPPRRKKVCFGGGCRIFLLFILVFLSSLSELLTGCPLQKRKRLGGRSFFCCLCEGGERDSQNSCPLFQLDNGTGFVVIRTTVLGIPVAGCTHIVAEMWRGMGRGFVTSSSSRPAARWRRQSGQRCSNKKGLHPAAGQLLEPR